jgi:hypothetical protein
VPVVIRPAGRMTTGTEQGGIRIIFHRFRGPSARLMLLDAGSYYLVGTVGFPILR